MYVDYSAQVLILMDCNHCFIIKKQGCIIILLSYKCIKP